VLALLSAAACAALGLPLGIGARAGFVDVCWAALASHLLLLVPLFRYREPAAPSAASESEPKRRAA
jgi:hypothetical protein